MSTIRTYIMDDLLAACREIQTDYGFATDVKSVYPFLTDPAQYPAVMVQEDGERVEYLAYPLAHRFLSVTVYGLSKTATTTRDDPDGVARDMIADIERAILADPTRAGNAVDTRLTGNEVMGIADDHVGVSVTFEVNYRTHLQDPTRSI
jgi:hypothetical protein